MALSADQLNTIYQNVLFRNVDTGGIQFFANRTDISDAQVRQQIELSAEATTFITPVVRLYQEVLGRVPDAAGLRFFTTELRQGFTLTQITQQFLSSAEFTSKTAGAGIVDSGDTGNQLVTDAFLSILGRTPATSEFAFFQGQSAAQVLAGVANSPEAAQFNAANVVTFLDSVAQGTYPTGPLNSQSGGTGGGSNGGQTVSLQTGVDTFVGTAGNDTINGVVDNATAANSTLTAADSINGAAGTDSLNITVTGAAAGSLPPANISNIENFFIRDVTTAGSSVYDFGTIVGEQQVWNDRSTAAVSFTNVGTSSTAGTAATIGIKGDGNTVIGGTTFTTATVTDAINIVIDGGTKGTGNITRDQTGATAVTISSTGAANSVGIIDLDNAGATITGLKINATTNLTASLAADYAANATLTVAGAASSVDLSGAALSANFKTVDASGLTAGGAKVVLGANTTSFIGGAGNDTVTINGLVFNGDATVAGGAGTGDILSVNDQAALTAATAAKISGFEILRITDDANASADTFDASLLTGLTGIQVAGTAAAGDVTTVNGLSAALAANVTVTGTQAGNLTFGVTNATTVGTADVLSIKFDDLAATKSTITVANLTAAGVEQVNINAVDNVTATSLTGLTGLTKLVVTGAGNVDLTTGALAINTNTTVDASGVTGTFTFTGAASTANGLAITGSATGVNNITGTGLADVIVGGSAADTLFGGSGADIITGGAGANTFVFTNASTGLPSATNFDTITDFRAGTGNKIDFGAITLSTTATATATPVSGTAAISSTGVATFNSADNTLALKLTALAAGVTASGGASVAGESAIFQQGNDAYLFVSDATDGLSATDVLIKLTGVTVGANGLTFSAGAGADITAIA
ncbi:DUF4214 domain-containing protein [Methylobacterium planeticum]|uniref:DUF4214 domain-containing protein n=1 Tax=Methylobacterium planeticum TaxID=2615211 RepID=A0A6N6MGZ7_9HYPH|nr:DUF4214 domain-containing protein [Methylobacterium planeticum]KAB1068740.1 DUF4214 domain-containing protein [Methylobacterium planeticum]